MDEKIIGRVGPFPEKDPPSARGGSHLDPAFLRAHLDGELGAWDRRRCARHLRACAGCRARLAADADLDRRAADLLAAAVSAAETHEGWRRVRVLAGSGAPGPFTASHRSRVRMAAAGFGMAAIAAALLLGVRAAGWSGRVGGQAASLQDLCCWDLDGGGPRDDGVVTMTLPGQQVLGLTLYEDRNGSRTLTGEDPIRFASTPEAETPAAEAEAIHGPPLVMRDVCCADYDRGGPSDDGVVTLSREGVVLKVAIYEDADASRTFSQGDPVRWTSGPR